MLSAATHFDTGPTDKEMVQHESRPDSLKKRNRFGGIRRLFDLHDLMIKRAKRLVLDKGHAK
jgi:hypothetical protein